MQGGQPRWRAGRYAGAKYGDFARPSIEATPCPSMTEAASALARPLAQAFRGSSCPWTVGTSRAPRLLRPPQPRSGAGARPSRDLDAMELDDRLEADGGARRSGDARAIPRPSLEISRTVSRSPQCAPTGDDASLQRPDGPLGGADAPCLQLEGLGTSLSTSCAPPTPVWRWRSDERRRRIAGLGTNAWKWLAGA